ncbi:MAG TPA: type IV toxin-antitoxin system AbiEi family antitoxin domain-containing protein [Actinomycetales bacterium]|nr:type IV toxin-antitoxin system AbiEi family antitoxin domain-containing protein [Actinomycetales bacterium]
MPIGDPPLPEVFTRAVAIERGLSHHQIVRRLRSGEFRRLRTGVYCLDDTWRQADRRRQHLLLAKGAYLAFPERCLSHVSAAAWHGLPLPFGATPVWLTGLPERGTWYDSQVHVQAAPLLRGHVIRADELKVTTLARTVADCLRHLTTEDALIIGDAAVARNSRLRAEVKAVLSSCTGWPFTDRARQRLSLLDGRHESPLESASFVEMRQHDLPLPEPQVWVRDETGRVVGRGDFYWEQFAVLGEADGLMKYDVGAGDSGDGRRALVEEKRREDRLRALGLHVVRWGLAELRSPGWAEWLRRELGKGDPGRFRGSVQSSRFL